MTDKERIKELEKKNAELEKQLASSRSDSHLYSQIVSELLIFLKERKDRIDALIPVLEKDKEFIRKCLASIGLDKTLAHLEETWGKTQWRP